MSRTTPADDFGVVADERLAKVRQAHRQDVLFEDDLSGQADEGNVVAEVCWTVVGMDLHENQKSA